MSAKTPSRSPILEAVHETASDLHRLGFIDERKMGQFDALCMESDTARLKVLQEAAHTGWADIDAGHCADVADDQLEDFIGKLGRQAIPRG